MKKKQNEQPVEETRLEEPKFSKRQLYESKLFSEKKDLIAALLPEGEYTISEARETIDNFLKG